MGLLRGALADGWTVVDGATCAQRRGRAFVVSVDQCPCPRLDRGCPVRLALDDGQEQGHVMILDANHRIVGINRTAPGYAIDDVLGQVPYERSDMAPAAQLAVREGLERATQRGYLDFLEFHHVRANGERVTWAGAVTPLVGPRGAVAGFRLELATVAPAKQTSGVSWSPVRVAT